MIFVFNVKWSQTDHENFAVRAENLPQARCIINATCKGAFYRDFVLEIDETKIMGQPKENVNW